MKRKTEKEVTAAPYHDEMPGPSFHDGMDTSCTDSESFLKCSSIISIKFIIAILFSLLRKYRSNCQLLKRENALLTRKIKLLEQKLKIGKLQSSAQPTISSTLLKKNSDCLFYTGIDTISLFSKLQSFIEPFERRRWHGFKCIITKVRNFAKRPKKFGSTRKLKRTLMLLRLD